MSHLPGIVHMDFVAIAFWQMSILCNKINQTMQHSQWITLPSASSPSSMNLREMTAMFACQYQSWHKQTLNPCLREGRVCFLNLTKPRPERHDSELVSRGRERPIDHFHQDLHQSLTAEVWSGGYGLRASWLKTAHLWLTALHCEKKLNPKP